LLHPSGVPDITVPVMDPVHISALRDQRTKDLQNALRQDEIQAACKRLGVSSSGSKATTTFRVENEMSFDVLVDQQLCTQKVINLSEEFEEEGPITRKDKSAKFSSAANRESDASARSREPNMTQGELARLIMVMADPLLQSEVSSMYASLSRAQLDRDGPAGQDPFRDGSVELMFNDTYFTPETPDACSGFEQEAIDSLDCAMLPECHRTGASLKPKRTSMRSRYSVAYKRFTSSGQSAHDNFLSFVERGNQLTVCFLTVPLLVIRA
jgi:hypothetical protein